MPKPTFFHLPAAKRRLVQDQLLRAFCQQPLATVRVSALFKETDFSRTSFYKYFESVEDARSFVLHETLVGIHHQLLIAIRDQQNDLFAGLTDFLGMLGRQDRRSDGWQKIIFLTRSDNNIIYRQIKLSADMPYADQWLALLAVNQFRITDPQEALSFQYFIMDLVINALTVAVANDWNADQLVADFAYKCDWIKHGVLSRE
ncbi:TetR/AcrR family transcriptional regulator [Lactiplantibacillus daowaiensis]|uniref:TetR/AcrR family transcriptional regulator n=1 Tax=Lactiplantibacillus daowaiensis TaxID=2559918 RepID=A0ABW1S011_9LACO|nr:TetR/AcrR family transcriptional regulator [Lactiplantibacillus daowaiensis]